MITRKSKHEFRVKVPVGNLVNTDLLAAMKDWCFTTFGTSGRNSEHRWRHGWVPGGQDIFYFRNEKDALLFTLRWV